MPRSALVTVFVLRSFKWVPTSQKRLVKEPEAPVELRSKRHMQLRTAFLKSAALRGFKNGDGKAGKTGEANGPGKKGCVEGRNLRRRRARSTSAAAGRAPASEADIPASSSSHSFSENTTATTLTPLSSQGVPSPCRDQDGSLLPSLPPLPPLPLAGRYLTSGTPERGKSAPPSRRGRRRGDKGLEKACLDAPDSGLTYGGGGVGRGGVSDEEDVSFEEKVDELLSEMSDLLVGEREHRYGVDGDSCVVELLDDESSNDGDFYWSDRVGSFYAADDCCVPPTRKPGNPYKVRQECARVSEEAREGAGGKEALPAMGNNPKASVRRNRDVAESESLRGSSTSGSLATAQETEQRVKSAFVRWPVSMGKEGGDEGHQTWWSRLRTASDGSAASGGSGGFFGQALSALAAATSFDVSLQGPTVTPGSSRVSRECTDDGDAAGVRGHGGGGGGRGGGSRRMARESETAIAENVSGRGCDESLIKCVAVPNAGLSKVGATVDGGAGVVTAMKRQAGGEGDQSGMTERQQQAAAPVARNREASMHDCETPSRSRRLLLESPFFRKAKGLSDLKKILGTEELREGFRQASDFVVPSSLPVSSPQLELNV